MKRGDFMSGILGISKSLSNSYESIASGKKINNSADNPSGLAIAEKENVQITGYRVGADNMESGREALNIADGAMSSVNDYLQRIRELAVSASNTATVSDSDRAAMQQEVEQLLQGISDVATNTSYNTNPLLDGTKTDYNIATDSNGNNTTISTANATLQQLGMEGFDLTGDFSISTVDQAIGMVSQSRTSMGAQSNALEYGINYNASASYYASSAKSRIEDTDYPKAISEQKKEEALLQYSITMQKKKMEAEKDSIAKMLK